MPQTRSTPKNFGSEDANDGTGEVTVQDNTTELLRSGIIASPTKKRRAGCAVTPKKRRRGNPGELCQLNLDVLFILATYIQPLDLLNLARTCKPLRKLLMDRSSAFVWRVVLRNINGLPDCPDDMNEPTYINLAFSPRCHGCGKYSSAILWRIRRRYCPSCRVERLRPYGYWPKAISRIICITAECISVDKEHVSSHDKDQVDLLMREYECSSDKEQFLSNKRKHFHAIHEHAKKCEAWKREMVSGRKDELNVRRQERHESILERLRALGYGPEISYFPNRFQGSRKAPPKPLTDQEWARMLPKWLETMNHHRRWRLDVSVYAPRRRLLASHYDDYVRHRSQDTPVLDLLPHVTDLARFLPFRNVIQAPEGTQMGESPFASAFAQLPELAEEWKKQAEAELAQQVTIPSHLSSRDALPRRVAASDDVTSADNFRLACALFRTAGHHLAPCPEVFLISTPPAQQGPADEDVARVAEYIRGRLGIEFLEEAPYVVHACGLDPGVATPEDMDHHNVRLRCLVCKGRTIIMNWRDAMIHACFYHRSSVLEPLANSPRWKLVTDEYLKMNGNVGELSEKRAPPHFWRCLLCHPRVGDASANDRIIVHLKMRHGLEMKDTKRGVHYAPLARVIQLG